ncbi:MAG: hypothetical protein IJH78_00335 [Clostridia bacterium]|nr:hypothetical protein [Clostridia bacterium]
MRRMKRDAQRPYSLRDRFTYWFDNHMARSSLGFIRVLIVASLVLAMLIAGLTIAFRFQGDSDTGSVIWDSIATVINAWMPYSDEGSPGYIAMMSVTAIAGVLFTSVLIGIITSAIEEKIVELKKGNSLVLERDHIVVLGFVPGEYALLHQLILAAEGRETCIVLAEDTDREEMERYLSENLELPKNCRIICRTANITDPVSIEKCSIETCSTVIISPTGDTRTIKALLAVSVLMQEKGIEGIRVNAIISRDRYRFPPSLAAIHNISTIQTNDILAKMIAHSCTQSGLSETFRELFNFEGSEFYLTDLSGIDGITFEELMSRVDRATPAGVYHAERFILNPPFDLMLREDDRILVFAEESGSARLVDKADPEETNEAAFDLRSVRDKSDTVILGCNETLSLVLRELPENISHVYLVDKTVSEVELEELREQAAVRELSLIHMKKDPSRERDLLEIARMAEHIVILSDHDKSPEEADMEVVFLLLNLRDLRSRFGFSYNITVEMQKEHNQKLLSIGDQTDFLVASSMSSLFLAQLAESPQLIDVFREILSNSGNELYLKNASGCGLGGTYTVRELRRMVLRSGYIFLGIVGADRSTAFNLPLDSEVTLGPGDELIVLGED